MEENKIKFDEQTQMIDDGEQSSKSASGKSPKNYIDVKLYNDSDFHIAIRQVNISASQILGSRKNQQDMYAVSGDAVDLATDNSYAWAVVCDGMGGMSSGEVASQTATEVMKQILESGLGDSKLDELLYQGAKFANNEVKKISANDDGMAGTTLVCVVIKNDIMHYVSVGDSRIYVCTKDHIAQITRDHNYMLELEQKVKEGLITAEDAASDPQKEALISYIGIDELTLVDVNQKPMKLQDEDIIILCSDGLTKVLNDSEIHAIVLDNYDNPENIVNALLQEVQIGVVRNLDNTTIAVMKYTKK